MEEFTPDGESPQTEPAAPPRTDPADHQLYQRPATAAEPVTEPVGYLDDDEYDTDPVGFPPIPPEPVLAPAPAPRPPPPPRPAPAAGPRRRRRLVVAAVLAAVALLAGAILAAATINGPAKHRYPAATATEAVGTNPAPPGPLTAPVEGRNQAVFNLVDGTSTIHLHAESLGDDLFRIATADGGSVAPRVEQTGADVKLYLRSTGRGGDGTVDISLNSAVRWTLRLSGGAATTVLDMTRGRVDGVELAGGATRIELALPRPQGPVPVRMTGGVDQFTVRLAKLTPVRVRVGSGAGEVTVGGTTHRGIAAGQSFTAYGWNDGEAGVDLQAVAGMSALTVTD